MLDDRKLTKQIFNVRFVCNKIVPSTTLKGVQMKKFTGREFGIAIIGGIVCTCITALLFVSLASPDESQSRYAGYMETKVAKEVISDREKQALLTLWGSLDKESKCHSIDRRDSNCYGASDEVLNTVFAAELLGLSNRLMTRSLVWSLIYHADIYTEASGQHLFFDEDDFNEMKREIENLPPSPSDPEKEKSKIGMVEETA